MKFIQRGLTALAFALLAACNTAPIPDTSDAMLMSIQDAPDETLEFGLQTQITNPTKALVRAIHLSPDAPAVDLFIDDGLVTQGLTYTNFVGPAQLPAGTRNLKVKAANTTTTVINADLNLEAGRRYSVFAAGKLAQIAPLVLEDTRYVARNAAKLRVLHGSPSAPRVDVYLSRPGTDIDRIDPILENVPFKSVSSYFRIRPGGLRVRVTLPDTKTVVIDSGALQVKAGDVLTAVAIDKPNTPGQFSAIVIDEKKFNAPTTAPKSIVEIAAGDPRFSTLVSALTASNLVPTLQGAGPFTVFAPTNDAFAKLTSIPGGDALKRVLLYHIARGKFTAAQLAGNYLLMHNGERVTAELVDGSLILNGVVKVVMADIQASNGIVHVIDTVLIPGDARVRAVHASFDAPAVNVQLDGLNAFTNLVFGHATDYASVPAGERNLKVNVASSGATAISANLVLNRDTDYTVLAVGPVASIEALVLNDTADGNAAPAAGKSKLRLIHAASQAGNVDVYITAPHASIDHLSPTIAGFAFKSNTQYLEVGSGSYQVRITLPGQKQPVIDTGAVTLPSGGVFTGVALDPAPGSSAFGALLLQDR